MTRTDATGDNSWTSAIVKSPVTGSVRLGPTGLDGDQQADLSVHGGPDKAVLAYAADHYPAWRLELGIEPFEFGAFGENFTVAGLGEATVCVGDDYAIGSARLQVSQPRQPCWKLARRWQRHDLPARVVETSRSGWYFRVLREGTVIAGDEVTLVARPFPEWTIVRVSALHYKPEMDLGAVRALSQCAALSGSWRRHFAEILT